jgi:hypothetical protein
VPDPGDNRTAASVVTPFTSIWSGVLWLYGVITGAIPANLTIDGALNVLADTYITGQLNSGKIVSTGDILGNGDLAAPGSASIGGHLTAATLDIPAGGYIDASGAGCAAYLPPTTMYGPAKLRQHRASHSACHQAGGHGRHDGQSEDGYALLLFECGGGKLGHDRRHRHARR